MELQDFPLPPHETLPTMYDLPSELPGESGLPDEFHRLQADLLSQTCRPANLPPDQVFTACDLNLYYDPHHPRWYKRPDWFVTLGVSRAARQEILRWSYVIWQEGRSPSLVMEFLSPGTEAEDLGQTLRQGNQPPTKWDVYEQFLRIPYYGVYDRYQNQLRLFRLEGLHYRELELPQQRYWLEDMGLGLGLWQGHFQGTEGLWLRWYDSDNHWVPTDAEQAEQERQRAEQERQRANRLADQLRQLGVDPDLPQTPGQD